MKYLTKVFGRLLRNNSAEQVVYSFTFKIVSGETQIPEPMIGAYVATYSQGKTPEDAANHCLNKLRSMGYIVESMEPEGIELKVKNWDIHISESWPEFASHFPKKKDLLDRLNSSGAVLGPFAGYEKPTGTFQ